MGCGCVTSWGVRVYHALILGEIYNHDMLCTTEDVVRMH